jgi:xylan 1,4-beta-xylosidase
MKATLNLTQAFAPYVFSWRLCGNSRPRWRRNKRKAKGAKNGSFLFRLFVLLSAAVASIFIASAQTSSPRRVISAYYTRVKGRHDKFFRRVVGAGRAAEGLRADWQRDFAVARRECGFEYVRFHGLLEDELGVYSEDRRGRPVYNFQYIDALYDAILNNRMGPFVEFGFMPKALASGPKTVFWWEGNITPPKDYGKWEQLIRALVTHWTERYGREEVRRWYFEVWNEPNLKDLFWSGDRDDYFKLYETTARAVKSVSPDYKVGGPATAGRGWIEETIEFAARRGVPLDFITTHDYGVEGIGFDEGGVQQLYLYTDPGAIIRGVRDVRAQIKASALPDLPLHYTEWSTSYSPRDPVHDSYVSAPYILSKLKGAEGYADSMSYWTFTDIFEENGPVPSPFHGGFGLLNFQGLRKPAFYAYKFLAQLGDEELASDDADSWTCRGPNGVQVLFWDFTAPQTKESDQVFYKRELPARAIGPVRVTLAGLPAGSYTLNVFQVGYRVNDVYTEYLKMNSPPTLTREQVRELAAKTDGRPTRTELVRINAGQTFTRDLALRENDVFLITLDRIKPIKRAPAR